MDRRRSSKQRYNRTEDDLRFQHERRDRTGDLVLVYPERSRRSASRQELSKRLDRDIRVAKEAYRRRDIPGMFSDSDDDSEDAKRSNRQRRPRRSASSTAIGVQTDNGMPATKAVQTDFPATRNHSALPPSRAYSSDTDSPPNSAACRHCKSNNNRPRSPSNDGSPHALDNCELCSLASKQGPKSFESLHLDTKDSTNSQNPKIPDSRKDRDLSSPDLGNDDPCAVVNDFIRKQNRREKRPKKIK